MAARVEAAPIRIIGAYLSPCVRRVLSVLEFKGLRYEVDPIVAFMGDDRFTALSPLRRVPVLIDDRVTLAAHRDVRRPCPRGRMPGKVAGIRGRDDAHADPGATSGPARGTRISSFPSSFSSHP